MIIRSEFKDYYDTAASFGADPTAVYFRKTREEQISYENGKAVGYAQLFNLKRGCLKIELFLVGFCGSIYPGARLTLTDPHGTLLEPVQHTHNLKSFFVAISHHGIAVDRKNSMSFLADLRTWRGSINEAYAKNFFEDMNWKRQFGEEFRRTHAPVFVIQRTEREAILKVNPGLKNYGFQKVKDPHTAFQEIHLYISGYLGTPPEKPTKQTDKENAASHGHDGPYSFRKVPGKRGRNRWR